ncbi:MAG: hypothetical protein ABIO29_09150 [Sphingomicrobium sp.]
MSVGYFVIAILGCADGGSSCTPVTTLPARYANERQCVAATTDALTANTDFDFPTLVARCREGKVRTNGRATITRDRAQVGR